MNDEMLSANALLGCDQMGACDRWTTVQGFASGIELMERAGAAIADRVAQLFPDAAPVHVLCGPGNNGGDGYVAARLLAATGREVRLYALAPPKSGRDAAIAASFWNGAVLPISAYCPEPGGGLLVDALFGAGFRGSLPGDAAAALERAAASGVPRLAVDVPSGMSGDTGLYESGIPFDATVTFFRKKPGHVLGAGPEVCGQVFVADIGVRADPVVARSPAAFENDPVLWQAELPIRARQTHKYRQGHAAVFSGPELRTGAARLSAQAAARIGAGAVTLLGTTDALRVHAGHVTSIMLEPCEKGAAEAILPRLNGLRSVVLGPGFSDLEEARAIARLCLSPECAGRAGPVPLVLDADGLTAFAANPAALFDLARGHAEPALVLTPHHGEFARLFPDIAAEAAFAKLAQTQKAADRSGAVVLFKGADTVIAFPGGTPRPVINTNGTPALATAGSGDVLAGIIAGLLAQGMPAFDAACAGAWLHGEAGRRAGPVCIAEDLIDALKPVYAALIA